MSARSSTACARSPSSSSSSPSSTRIAAEHSIDLVLAHPELFGDDFDRVVSTHAAGAEFLELGGELVRRRGRRLRRRGGEDDRHFAVDRRARLARGHDVVDRPVDQLLVQLRHLARDGDLDVAAEDLAGVAQRIEQALRRLVDDRRVADRGELAVEVEALAVAVRREAEEGEGEGSDAAGGEREDAGERAGDRLDDDAALARQADDAIAGIADDRHAGIADDGDGLAGDDALDVLLRALVFGVLVEALGRRLDAEVREELARVARVFAEDERRRIQRLGGARGKVAEVLKSASLIL